MNVKPRPVVKTSPRPLSPGGMLSTAKISDCGLYRYELTRTWDYSKPTLLFVMLMPSIADADIDDPTIRVCVGRAKLLNFGSIRVVNLFAYRSTDPKVLYSSEVLKKVGYMVGMIGPVNDAYIYAALEDENTTMVICAWGENGRVFNRGDYVKEYIWDYHELQTKPNHKDYRPRALKLTKHGYPAHPLRISYSTGPVIWERGAHG